MTLEDKIRIERKVAREEVMKVIAKRLKEVLGLSDEQIKEIIDEK